MDDFKLIFFTENFFPKKELDLANTGTTVFIPSENGSLNLCKTNFTLDIFTVPTFGTDATELPPILFVPDGKIMFCSISSASNYFLLQL